MRLANIRNGLAYPHDGVCCFQSQHGHNYGFGYFRMDAMPYEAVIRLLVGGEVTIVDATQHRKKLTDAQKFGVVTWCAVYNRALRLPVPPCDWFTREMRRAAYLRKHRPLVRTIRKLLDIYAPAGAPTAMIDVNVHLECHHGFALDDKPALLRKAISEGWRDHEYAALV